MRCRRNRRARARGLVATAGPLFVILGACSGGGEESVARADLVGPDEFAARMDGPEAVVVNVHVPYEGEIPGTDLFVPFDGIASSDDLPAGRDRPLLVYCRTGNMSADATADLVEAGYPDVTDLQGGMVAWQADGRTVETDPERRAAGTG